MEILVNFLSDDFKPTGFYGHILGDLGPTLTFSKPTRLLCPAHPGFVP
jgi:hypothetical protein